jgi:hypothetical protein
LAVDTFRNDTSGYTPELKWSVLKVLLKVSTAKTGCHGSVSKIPYYLRGSVLKVSTAQGIPNTLLPIKLFCPITRFLATGASIDIITID